MMRLGPINPAGQQHMPVVFSFASSSRWVRHPNGQRSLARHLTSRSHTPWRTGRATVYIEISDAVRVITSSDHLPAAHQPDCARIGSISVTPARPRFRVGTLRPAH